MVAFNICAGIVAAYVIFAAVEENDVKSKIDNYDSATLMNIADGIREEMSNLQDRLERVTDLMWERLAEEKGITKGG